MYKLIIEFLKSFATFTVISFVTKGFPSLSPPGQKPIFMNLKFCISAFRCFLRFFNNPGDTLKNIFSRYQTSLDASSKGVGFFFLKKGVHPNWINTSRIEEESFATMLFFKSSIIPNTLLG